jgi:hypothetical protein
MDFGRLDERVLALSGRVDDRRDEIRALRLRVDAVLVGIVGVIATLAVKL